MYSVPEQVGMRFLDIAAGHRYCPQYLSDLSFVISSVPVQYMYGEEEIPERSVALRH
jgi:hypothetical protein